MVSEENQRKAAALALQQVQAMLDDPDHDKYSTEELMNTRDNLIEYIKDARSD